MERRQRTDDEDLLGETEGAVIRRVFAELGSNVPARIVATTIIKQQLLPVATLQRYQERGLIERIRSELKRKEENGLPYAQPVGADEGATWKAVAHMTQLELFGVIERRYEGIRDDIEEVRLLHAYCQEKFDVAPDWPFYE